MKKRTLPGNIAIGTCALALVLVTIAFTTASWLVSDKGARRNHLGLWTHCFKWYSDSNALYDRRFLGCQDEIRGFSIPSYNRGIMTTTQIFYSISFICSIVGAIFSAVYFFFCSREHKRFNQLIKASAWILLAGGICGALAVIIFVSQRDVYVWMPFNNTISFGWSFYVACISVVAMLTSAIHFLRDARLHTVRLGAPKSLEHTVVDMK